MVIYMARCCWETGTWIADSDTAISQLFGQTSLNALDPVSGRKIRDTEDSHVAGVGSGGSSTCSDRRIAASPHHPPSHKPQTTCLSERFGTVRISATPHMQRAPPCGGFVIIAAAPVVGPWASTLSVSCARGLAEDGTVLRDKVTSLSELAII